jgi:hypothetical protein
MNCIGCGTATGNLHSEMPLCPECVERVATTPARNLPPRSIVAEARGLVTHLRDMSRGLSGLDKADVDAARRILERILGRHDAAA